jgi:5-methylcytosine-specific restriction endonuclease McrA
MLSSRKVLLLNATYEPLSLVTPPKAVTLIWRRVAESIEIDPGQILRSPRYVFEVPSVIRLTQYIDVRARQNRVTNRHRILAGSAFDLTLDHIMPKSRGGRTVAENLVTSCRECNNRKSDRTPDEARMPLLTNPSALYYGLERGEFRRAAETRPEWRKYLFLEDWEEQQARDLQSNAG